MSLLLAGLLALLGCGSGDLKPIPQTTARVAPPVSAGDERQSLRLYLFSDLGECINTAGEDDAHLCTPFIDRATGQVRVAFQMRVDNQPWPVALAEENIEVYHKNQRVLANEGRMDYTLIPHDPTPAEQLFILLIDSSGSMAIDDGGRGVTRMDKVRAALLRQDVVDAFFPGTIATAVVPLYFRGGLPEALGGKLIVENKKDYRQLIKTELQVGSGFTYLYQAVEYASTTLLEKPEIKEIIQLRKMQPTIVVLTDGFNNETPQDLCSTNAPRLEKLLKRLDEVRRGNADTDIRYRPTVFTVGLGRKAWPKGQPKEGISVSNKDLCGGKGDMIINGGIERGGVDNRALSWIAQVGGGNTYVSRTTQGLGDAFKGAAATRYRWFEARYRVDPFFLRRSFQTKLLLNALMGAEATMYFHPSAWLDGPPGKPADAEGWTVPTSYTVTTTLVLPILGALAAIGYLPAALFNVRRALFSRVVKRPTKKR